MIIILRAMKLIVVGLLWIESNFDEILEIVKEIIDFRVGLLIRRFEV